jgi:hypothetical protein
MSLALNILFNIGRFDPVNHVNLGGVKEELDNVRFSLSTGIEFEAIDGSHVDQFVRLTSTLEAHYRLPPFTPQSP